MLKKSSYKALGLLTFIVSIAAGGLQFANLSFLNHVLTNPNFSQISTIFGTFTIYFVIIEFGIQADVIRRLSKQLGKPVFGDILALRALLAVTAILATCVFIVVSELSSFLAGALFFYSLSYIPIAMLLCLEELGYAKQSLFLTLLHRTARIVGLIVFIAMVGIIILKAEQSPTTIENPWLFLAFPALYLTVALPGLHWAHRHGFLSKPDLKAIWILIKDMKHLFWSTLFRWLTAYLYSILVLRVIGETSLSAYNVSYMLMAPLSLLIQILVNVVSAKMFGQDQYHLASQLKFVSLLVLGACLGYIAIFSFPLTLNLFFRSLDHTTFLKLFVPLGFAQVFTSLVSMINVGLMDRSLSHVISWGSALQGATIGLCYVLMPSAWFSEYYTAPIFIGILVGYGIQHGAGAYFGLFKSEENRRA
ncbi:hypothetical protein [Pseudobacteriovorax antillogorgiicola]|uniref:Membrane protein involved in the export of O-antigen and teichoic acid n=1 Tax=Pseudobacteriovorax antillogorgiicola TaxID=1513793 RepID=A0A1Y6C7V9_9BACT|nr:hypothetical protein [Pseudobacteriovorax antillogorgiicola]TCS51733.1 O-antigen/teichoic acid export membrane protein [Pseudobacteriovorax antillogorgiicola]SMF49579.1 Membrane protein involved in the export of O-antigen and teichoic acid [Pseudobacteriovorax antillogorgiicola]